jgi:N-acyl-D-aspartate/D-glutamate deacylase
MSARVSHKNVSRRRVIDRTGDDIGTNCDWPSVPRHLCRRSREYAGKLMQLAAIVANVDRVGAAVEIKGR